MAPRTHKPLFSQGLGCIRSQAQKKARVLQAPAQVVFCSEVRQHPVQFAAFAGCFMEVNTGFEAGVEQTPSMAQRFDSNTYPLDPGVRLLEASAGTGKPLPLRISAFG